MMNEFVVIKFIIHFIIFIINGLDVKIFVNYSYGEVCWD